MPRKKKPHEMTSDELIKHLFHPKIVEHLKKVAKESTKKATKRSI
jgi:hypothetical protein